MDGKIFAAPGACPACGMPLVPQEKTFSANDIQAEFAELYERLRASHYDLYARRSKSEYDALYATMRATFTTPMNRAQVIVPFLKFIAFGNVAHAMTLDHFPVYAAYVGGGGKIMPLRFRVVNGSAHVIENGSSLPEISRGDEIVTLNGEPMSARLKQLRTYLSADNDYLAYAMLEEQFPALTWMEMGSIDKFDCRLRTVSGKMIDVAVPARTAQEIQSAVQAQTDTLNVDWRRRESRTLADGIAYLRPGIFLNSFQGDLGAPDVFDTTAFSRFIDGAFQSFMKNGARRLIIDLRNNPGGDNSFSDLMVSWFADRPYRMASDFRIKVSQAAIDTLQRRGTQAANKSNPLFEKLAAAYKARKLGEVFSLDMPAMSPRNEVKFEGVVFILINRHSFSQAVNIAATAQDYRFATVLGEETADLATTYGSMDEFKLSRTGINVYFPKAYIIRPSGNTDARGVVPDVAIETPIVETAKDSVLARAIEIARSSKA